MNTRVTIALHNCFSPEILFRQNKNQTHFKVSNVQYLPHLKYPQEHNIRDTKPN